VASRVADEGLTVNDDRAGFALAPQSVADSLVDGAGRRAGAAGGGPPAASRSAAVGGAGAGAARGRRAARRSGRRGGRDLGQSARLPLTGVRVELVAIVAGREQVARQPAQRVDVVVKEDQHHRVDGGVRPCHERQQLVDLGRLLELRVDQGQDVQRVPGEDEENGGEDEDVGSPANRMPGKMIDRLDFRLLTLLR